MSQQICILSTGRVGTTYLSRAINELLGEPVITHQGRYSRLLNVLGNTALSHLLPAAAFARLLPDVMRLKLLESTCDPLRSIPLTIALRSASAECDYRLVHLVRDPRDFVTSFMNWKNQSIKRFVLHHIMPFWQPNPVFVEGLSLAEWLRWSKFDQAATSALVCQQTNSATAMARKTRF